MNNLVGDGKLPNAFMNIVLDGIPNGFANGIEYINASGEKFFVFIDVVALIVN